MPKRVLVGYGIDVDAVSGWYVPTTHSLINHKISTDERPG